MFNDHFNQHLPTPKLLSTYIANTVPMHAETSSFCNKLHLKGNGIDTVDCAEVYCAKHNGDMLHIRK